MLIRQLSGTSGPQAGEGARLVVAPRVLVDATAVPADRGALGRYVDGLVRALGAAGADLAVACQRADEERYGRLVPEATRGRRRRPRSRTGRPGWPGSRAACRWSPSRSARTCIHSPHYSMPLRPGVPVVVTIHDLTFFTEPDAHSPVTATFYKSAIRTSARRATRLIVPSKATRDELVRVLGADPTRIDVAYHGVDHTLFHQPDQPRAVRQVVRPARPARPALRRLPGHAGAAQERARADHRAGRPRWPT